MFQPVAETRLAKPNKTDSKWLHSRGTKIACIFLNNLNASGKMVYWGGKLGTGITFEIALTIVFFRRPNCSVKDCDEALSVLL